MYNGDYKIEKDERLIGKTVANLSVENGESRLFLAFTDGTGAGWETHGDCCSETWFADILNLDALDDAPIKSIVELELAAPDDNRSRQECDNAYGFELRTDKGACTVVYRNSSNGYYGGDIVPYERDNLGDWKDVLLSGDWRAPGSG